MRTVMSPSSSTALRSWWQIWWQIWGCKGIGGDMRICAYQQLTDSVQPPPDFESLSLRQFMPRRWGIARTIARGPHEALAHSCCPRAPIIFLGIADLSGGNPR